MINRADLLAEAVLSEQDALMTPPPVAHDGWGVGFYQADEVLHKKHPQPTNDKLEWSAMLHGIRSHVAIAHVRDASVGPRRADNNHPFRMRQWLFAHAGMVEGFAAIQPRLLESMPDFLRRNIRGDTDSEHVFHVFLSFLHDAGQLDSMDVADQAVMAALRSTIALIDRMVSEIGAPKSNLDLVLTNGRQLYALRRGSPMIYVERDRLSMPEHESGKTPRPVDPVRYVLVANVANGVLPPDYRPLEDGQLISIDRDQKVTSYSL
ncbi:MAG TPA: class II glutamine amidotransferase [Polyangiales bacterium]|nr:class II glutamine amidotransferase [Polyangiales bacterium]